jgi:hypothetical protein
VFSFLSLETSLMNRFFCALLGAAALLFPAVLAAQSGPPELPEANPGRPTVSTPATLTPVGYLQFENGGVYANNSPEFSTRFGINQVTKLTVASRIQLLALSEPFTHSTGAEVNGNRPGEVFAGVQTVLLKGEEHRPTISASYIRRLYESPAPEIDIGTFRQNVLLLVSDDMGGFHFDLNGIVTEQAENTVRRAQFGQTPHGIGRIVALLPAVNKRECRRQPLGRLLSDQEESRSRRWVQPRLHQHLDPVGGVRWIH